MPRIKPFQAIHPSPGTAGKVTLQVESLSIEKAKSIRKENPLSYVNLLVPRVENPYGRGSKQELAFKKINETLEEFLEKGILVRDSRPSIYVYRITSGPFTQHGIWTVTRIDDYLNNTIRRHELTLEERERGLIDYLRQTGIDGNPVLITYLRDEAIENCLTAAMNAPPLLHFGNDNRTHELWKISDETGLSSLIQFFSALPGTYIADGHHRAAAACGYAIERRKGNLKHNGEEEYNFFTSVYMSADQLQILSFHRAVTDLGDLTREDFLSRVGECFLLTKQEQNRPLQPNEPGVFGLYFNREWYRLVAKETACLTGNPADELDVSILQDRLFGPVLGINDPRNDKRLQFIGGTTTVEELARQVDAGVFALAFTVCPTSIRQLMAVADAGETMPPKSTWFEPKFQAGLVVHKMD